MYRRDHTDKQGPQVAHEARLTRRAKRARQIRRRRSVCTLALSGALTGVAMMLVATAGAPANHRPGQAHVKLVVNVKEDVGAQSAAVVADVDGPQDMAAVTACLSTTLKGTKVSPVQNEPGGPGGVEDKIDGPHDPDGSGPGSTAPVNGPQLDTGEDCSFRLALQAANALGATNPYASSSLDDTAGTHAIEIVFTDSAKNLTLTEGVPLPPILGDHVTIDGCGDEDPPATPKPKPAQQPAPCVTLDLDGSGVSGSNGGGIVAQQLHNANAQIPNATVVPEVPAGLIAVGRDTTIKGLAFEGNVGTAILALSPPMVANAPAAAGKLTVQNSWFGRTPPTTSNPLGTQLKAGFAPDVGIQLSGRNALIGGTELSQRNVFSAADVGVLIAGGKNNQVVGNLFGTDSMGAPLTTGDHRLTTGVRLRGLGVDADYYTAMVERASGLELVDPIKITRQSEDNTIGALIAAGGPATANGTGPCEGNGCNAFAGLKGAAIEIGGPPLTQIGDVSVDTVDPGDLSGSADIDLGDIASLTNLTKILTVADAVEGDTVGVDETRIYSNRIGLGLRPGSTATAADNVEAGIRIRTGSRGTQVGGSGLIESGNVISNNEEGGVVLDSSTDLLSETGAGLGTRIAENVGFGNDGPLIDLGGDGKGNDADGPSGGIQAPQITSASPTQVSGTAAPDSEIDIYRVMSTNRYGDVDAHVGEADADESGNWSAKVSGVTGRQVTATADVVGTSELAENVTVVAPSTQVVKKEEPTPEPPDVTAPSVKEVMGKDPEAGPVVIKKAPKEFSGEVADASGVAQVKVALQIVKLDPKSTKAKPKGKGKAPKCKYVHLSKGTVLQRPCDTPPFAEADTEATSDGASWEVPISKKAQARLRPGRYLLHIQTVDTNGNVDTHAVPLRRKG